MTTAIFTTKKLEKTISKHVSDKTQAKKNDYLGDWNANIFYAHKKKCWLLMNYKTKYVVVLNGIKASDIKNIDTIFKETFYNQLIYDGIIVDYKLIEKIIGKVQLFSTNNNRSATGSINDYLLHYKDWVSRSNSYDEMNFKKISGILNTLLLNTILNFEKPKKPMSELLNSFV